MFLRKPADLTEWLLLLGALSFVPTLFFYLVGEEGTYVITSMEMWHRQNWMQQLMYGADNGRPPLVNWLTMPLSALLGWEHVVFAVRLVSVGATLGTVGVLYWLARKLFADKPFSVFAALTVLTLGDWLLYRGWLSYTDPVFAFFTFGALAALWVGAVERRRSLLLLSVVLVSCALLTKAFTAYVFYGTAGFVLLWQRETRRFLLSPRSLLVFALALVVPGLWFASIPHGSNSAGMLDEITRKLSAQDMTAYLLHLLEYPLEVMLRLSPAVLLALYLVVRRRVTVAEDALPQFRAAAWIAVLAFLPYWLSPQSSIRYLLPVYPLIALVCARLIWRAGDAARVLALRWFAAVIALKFAFALVLFPAYQAHYRGENYAQAAQVVIARTQGFPLYVTDVRSVGIAIAAYIDIARFPQAPLTFPPQAFDSGFVLSMEADAQMGEVAETYTLAADKIYLLCRGAACAR
jgi:4-amino-4-deoxy-L-arabinose transferase-like glycosyltransferase